MSSQVPGKGRFRGFIYRWLNSWMPESWLHWLSDCFAPEPIYPLRVDLTAMEKAKMDYEHGLKVKEMRWDKGFFAIVLAIVGVIGYYKANRYFDDNRAAIATAAERDKAEITKALEESRTK